jgi:hypothetical protein
LSVIIAALSLKKEEGVFEAGRDGLHFHRLNSQPGPDHY